MVYGASSFFAIHSPCVGFHMLCLMHLGGMGWGPNVGNENHGLAGGAAGPTTWCVGPAVFRDP